MLGGVEPDAATRAKLMDDAACQDCYSTQGWVNHIDHPMGFRWSIVVHHDVGCPVLAAHRRTRRCDRA